MTWERALEADARLAAKNAVLVRAALRQAIDPERIYTGYKNTTPDESLSLPQQRVRARAWAIMNVRVNLEPLKEVIYRLWAQGYALGDTAAREAVADARAAQKAETASAVDWSKWKPGDAVAALLLKPPRAFQQLLEQQGITFKGFSDTTLTDIGNSVGEAIYLGLDAKKSAKLIGQHVANPARALSIAITEQNRAISQATVNRYRDAGLQQQEWLVFQPCNICAQNANKVVNIGAPFPSGHIQPPAHPHCRCALAPVIPGFNDPANTAGSMTAPSITPNGTVTPPVESYRMRHQAPTRADDFGSPATDIGTEMMPGFYENPRNYTSLIDASDKESVRVLMRIRNKPDEIVTIYRAVPEGVNQINPGDWVTLSPTYAKQHLASNLENGRVISAEIPAKDLWFNGDSINEFGFDPLDKKPINVAPVIKRSTEFKSGNWYEMQRDEVRDMFIERAVAAMPGITRLDVQKAIMSGKMNEADLDVIRQGVVIQNGPIEVMFIDNGLSINEATRKKLLKEIDDLQVADPKDKMVVVVTERGEDKAYGSAVLGDAKIWIKPHVVRDNDPLTKELGFKMPAIATVPHRQYTLTHEWGHSRDVGGHFGKSAKGESVSIQNAETFAKVNRLKFKYSKNPDAFVSRYATENTKEFYAEMYAEWMLTKGATTNPLVREMAETFGWNKFGRGTVSGPDLGVVEANAIKPIKLDTEPLSVARNAEIEAEIEEMRALIPGGADDDRLLDALVARGSRGESDNTDIYWSMKKKLEAAGYTPTNAKDQLSGMMLRAQYYLENKQLKQDTENRLKAWLAEGELQDVETYKKNSGFAQERILTAMQEGRITIAVDKYAINQIFTDKRFKNQFESKRSGGLLDPTTRKIREKATFDIDLGTPSKKRPIYGYVTTNTNTVDAYRDATANLSIDEAWNNILSLWNPRTNQYGTIKVVLKDSVRTRTTVTLGDSLNRGVLAETVTAANPDLENMGFYRWGAPDHTGGNPAMSYLEAQISGGVTIEDIDSIFVDTDGPVAAVQELVKQSGLDIKVIPVKGGYT